MFRKKPQPLGPPTWLIVGLGNPGPEYRGTRHNIGFDVVDCLAKEAGAKFATGRHRAIIAHAQVGETSVMLVKPLTFMNLSGQAVAPLAAHAGLKPDRVLIVADDLDLPLGKVRYRASGSAGGHNGHKSIIQSLGTTEYPRLKIGIGRGGETINHVLGGFNKEERVIADRAILVSCAVISDLINSGEQAALHTIERMQAGQ